VILKILQRIGARRPYFNIYGADGSLYMGRSWLFGGSNTGRDSDDNRPEPRTWARGRFDAWIGKYIAGRLHYIAREDRARDLHTHPASFISIVIAGWYVERRPKTQRQPASLDDRHCFDTARRPGSIAFRRAADRHTIVEVSPGGAWTVVIWFRKQGGWGFWTKNGFVHWRNYEEAP
jgi:hypothetical protein